MTTTTQQARSASGTSGAPTATGPLARVVLASLVTGGGGALVLTLLVFPGAREHTITGTALFAFATGWAMLADLTTRFTSQPQRWARVPAAGMAATGLALTALAPSNDGLTAAGWVWPPLLLALTTWMVVQLRRTMTSRARWLIYPVLTGMALASAGGLAETLALEHDSRTIAMPGQLYGVGDHRLHMYCTGTGSPALLRATGEPGPYLLVGHSLGGIYSMTFAAQYPSDVAGLVLLDSSTPEQFTALPDFASEYTMIRRLYGILPSVARLGIGRLFSSSTLPEPAAGQVRAFGTSSRGLESARDESSRYRASFRQAQALRTLNGKPLVVLTAAGTIADTAGWSAAQDKMATLSSNVLHAVANTTHAGMLTDRSAAAESSKAIDAAVRSVRTQRPVSR